MHTDGLPQVSVHHRPAAWLLTPLFPDRFAPPPVRSGPWSVRFALERTDPVINNGTRAELTAGLEPPGAERRYGFSIYLPRRWAADSAAEILTQ
jgi:hypothetical protein